MPSRPPLLSIGTVVSVSFLWIRHKWYENGRYVIEWRAESVEPFVAVVSGYGRRQVGTVRRGSYDDPSDFRSTGTVFVALVRRGLTNHEMPVPLEGIEKCEGSIPFAFCKTLPFSDRDREAYREYAAEQPRAANGRWK